MLSVEHLDASIGRLAILHDVSLEVAPGEVVGVLGPNGAGKSTLLSTIAGRIPRTAGKVLVDGEDWSSLRAHVRAQRGLRFVPEGRGLFPNLTATENLRMSRTPLDEDLLARILEMFPGLAKRMGVRAGSLSGGEQQMLVLARAFAARPRLLLLDEPTLGLAPMIVSKVQEVMKLAGGDCSILLAEQNPAFTSAVCDRIYLLGSGRIQRQLATGDEIDVAEFLGLTDPAHHHP